MPIESLPGRGALAPFVGSLWVYRSAHSHALERILPSPSLQLLVNLDEDALRAYRGQGWREERRIGGAGVVGVRGGPCAIDTREQRHIAGVAFRPGGAWPFLGGVPANELADRELDLSELWGRAAARLREQLLEAPNDRAVLLRLEAALLEQLAGAGHDRAIAAAVERLHGGERVRDAAHAVGMAAATFRRRFAARVGASPKRFARVARLHRTLSAIGRGQHRSWADLAFAQGFADQSHLIRELRALGGLTPADYAARADGALLHVVES